MNTLVASIIALGLLGAAAIFAWSRRGSAKQTDANTEQAAQQAAELAERQAAEQARSVQQMLQMMQSTQAELARQRETITADQARLREELRKSLGDNQQVM